MIAFRILLIAALLAVTVGIAPEPVAQATPATSLEPGNSDEGPAGLLQFTAGGHVLGFQPDGVYVVGGDHALKVTFDGARGVAPLTDRSPSTHSQAQPLDKVTYLHLWDGIRLTYEQVEGGIAKSSYLVEPGADVDQIQLLYNVPVQLEASGSLRFVFETGQMRESAPVAWQEIAGQRLPVDVAFRLLAEREVGFALGEHNPAYSLVIDPTWQWIRWHTFMGSSGDDCGYGIAVDGSGNVYVTGRSYATWGDSPVNAYAGGLTPLLSS
jgi:hypothetical protein